jgi:hypothetical protein
MQGVCRAGLGVASVIEYHSVLPAFEIWSGFWDALRDIDMRMRRNVRGLFDEELFSIPGILLPISFGRSMHALVFWAYSHRKMNSATELVVDTPDAF